ncbi:MAG: putative malate transporter YflS [Chlamydiia bacterium]|nr:putative malate transporter YflS [Chlamydiia bacterium]
MIQNILHRKGGKMTLAKIVFKLKMIMLEMFKFGIMLPSSKQRKQNMATIAAAKARSPLLSGLFQNKLFYLLICFAIGGGIWVAPHPENITGQGWHLFAIFVATVLGLIIKPLPMGGVAFLSLTVLTFTKTLTFTESFSGFTNPIVWLIVTAFFIARGFIKTGLGMRIAYVLMRIFGKSTLGMAYAMAMTDVVLAPTIPSVTARAGGVIFPVVTSLSKAFGSDPETSPRRIGSFLIQSVFQSGAVTSAMFLTAMAGNPLVAGIAASVGVNLTWGGWAVAALVPGLVSLAVIPWIMYKIYPPELKHTPEAKAIAEEKLKEMGPISRDEWVMIGSFVGLIILWVFGQTLGVDPTVTALLGLSFLLISKVLSWKDVLSEGGAWDTLMWFAVLVMMAGFLGKFGITGAFSNIVQGHVSGLHWIPGFAILAGVYFYSHYFFASNLAHISALMAPFLALAIAIGTPPVFAVFILGFFSSLFGTLTQYGSGPAPILFAAGYVPIGKWWQLGLLMSLINIVIWVVVGSLWWTFLGLM